MDGFAGPEVQCVEVVTGIFACAIRTRPTHDVKRLGVNVDHGRAENSPSKIDSPSIDFRFTQTELRLSSDLWGNCRANVLLPKLLAGIYIESVNVVGHGADHNYIVWPIRHLQTGNVERLSLNAGIIVCVEGELAKLLEIWDIGRGQAFLMGIRSGPEVIVGAGEYLRGGLG